MPSEPAPSTSPATTESAQSLFSPRFLLTSVGAIALVFLGAFEALAVTTVMPAVTEALDGRDLYSVGFSAVQAASVIGMVVAGGWADRRGPVRPLLVAVAVFFVGLLLAGLAPTMQLFIAGRFSQGLGSGAINVALYVVVARMYPAELHPKIFGAFAAAWVIPSMIGPAVAGLVSDAVGWQWVFLGVAALVVVATVLMLGTIRELARSTVVNLEAGVNPRSLLLAAVVAIGVVTIGVSGEIPDPFSWIVAASAMIIVLVCVRSLLPAGTLRAARGLPAVILLRGLVAGAFFATEVYLPLLLATDYGLPAWAAGLILTVGALSWAGASAVQGRLGARLTSDTALRVGAVLVVVGILIQFLTAALLPPFWVSGIGWLVAGAGMGTMYPRISTLVLAGSTTRDQGFNSSAMSISDAVGASAATAFAGLVFTAFGGIDTTVSFATAIAMTLTVAVATVPVAVRARSAHA